jgi:hypothetical protein
LLWNVLRDTFLCCSFDAVNCSQACGVGWSIAMRYFISSKLRIQHGVSRVSGRNWFCLTSHQLCRMLSLGDDLLRLLLTWSRILTARWSILIGFRRICKSVCISVDRRLFELCGRCLWRALSYLLFFPAPVLFVRTSTSGLIAP